MCRDALDIQLCECVGEELVPLVNKQEKISSEDGLLEVCNDEVPPEHPTEFQVKCKRLIAKGQNRGATAYRLRWSCRCICSVRDEGTTLTSAPVSMRN